MRAIKKELCQVCLTELIDQVAAGLAGGTENGDGGAIDRAATTTTRADKVAHVAGAYERARNGGTLHSGSPEAVLHQHDEM